MILNFNLSLIFIPILIYFPMIFHYFFPPFFYIFEEILVWILEIFERIQNSRIKGGDARVRFAIFDRNRKSSVSLPDGTCKNSVDQGLELHVGWLKTCEWRVENAFWFPGWYGDIYYPESRSSILCNDWPPFSNGHHQTFEIGILDPLIYSREKAWKDKSNPLSILLWNSNFVPISSID